jgi:hypothetical protein
MLATLLRSPGLQQNDDVVIEVLRKGSMFYSIVEDHWRHLVDSYYIVTSWGGIDNIRMKNHGASIMAHNLSETCWFPLSDRGVDCAAGEHVPGATGLSRRRDQTRCRPKGCMQVWVRPSAIEITWSPRQVLLFAYWVEGRRPEYDLL